MNRAQLEEFFERLKGPGGCDYVKNDHGSATWKCNGGMDKSTSMQILKDMGIQEQFVKNFLKKCERYGGFCDCEILLNAKEKIFAELIK